MDSAHTCLSLQEQSALFRVTFVIFSFLVTDVNKLQGVIIYFSNFLKCEERRGEERRCRHGREEKTDFSCRITDYLISQ